MIKILIVLLCGFGFAISGEHFFGRWRRGALLLPIMIVVGAITNVHWVYYVLQVALAWGVYQSLFYDECIQEIWDEGESPFLGYLGLFLNGLLIGLQPFLLHLIQRNNIMAVNSLLICGVAVIFVCIGSNVWKWKLPGKLQIVAPDGSWTVSIWGGHDSWWVSEFFMGLAIGVCFIL